MAARTCWCVDDERMAAVCQAWHGPGHRGRCDLKCVNCCFVDTCCERLSSPRRLIRRDGSKQALNSACLMLAYILKISKISRGVYIFKLSLSRRACLLNLLDILIVTCYTR
jgi:hypothetical protein